MGGGDDGIALVRFLLNEGISIKAIIDSDVNKSGMRVNGISIYHLKDKFCKFENNTFAFITTFACNGFEQSEITTYLNEIGIQKYFKMDYPSISAVTRKFEWIDAGRRKYYLNNIQGIKDILKIFSDKESLDNIVELLKVYFEGRNYKNNDSLFKYKYFYGQGNYQDKKIENLYSHLDDEVWINCGACEGETIWCYFENGFKAKKILAYEGNNDSTAIHWLNKNISMLPEKYREKDTIVNEFITENTDWKQYLDSEQKISFINADVDGAEMELLEGCKTMICEHRPVIAICVYHKPEDIIVIPKYISQIVENYFFYIRKFAENMHAGLRRNELVLYAIPQERHDYKWIELKE